MAKKPSVLPQQITLVGQSDSGKTNLLATLLGNSNAHNDLLTGPDRVADVSWTPSTNDTTDDKEVDKLLSYTENILRGRVLSNEGSENVRVYPCSLSYRAVERTTRRNGLFGAKEARETLGEKQTVAFNIADGPGGTIAPAEYLDPNNPQDTAAIQHQTDYRNRLNESAGVVIIMPADKDGFKIDLAQRLVREINRTIDVRRDAPDLPKLRNIAICFTKYDELFSHRGGTAGEKARDPDEAVVHFSNTAMIKEFEPLIALAESDPELNVCVFPVSTFGFVNGTGAANFYNLETSPGLLTRAIKASRDWEDPDAPELKSHFPFEVTENEAKTLWRPFNIAPPLFFALTGKVTGPLYLDPSELLVEEEA